MNSAPRPDNQAPRPQRQPLTTPDRAFVSIVDWPAHFNSADQLHALVSSCGLDPFIARQMTARTIPMVVAAMPTVAADSAVGVLHDLGVSCFAPNQADLNSVPAPIAAKRLTVAIGSQSSQAGTMFLCEPWRGETIGLRARDILLMVRARLMRVQRSTVPRDQGPFSLSTSPDDFEGGWAFGGAFDTANTPIGSTSRVASSDVIDLHLVDRDQPRVPGPRIRIDGRKFSFDILGPARGFTDHENADRLAVMLAESAPRAIIDTAFTTFTVAPGMPARYFSRVESSRGRVTRDDHPVFEFYSAWACLMYRRLLGADAPS